jgi:hypothetical protein
MPDPVALSRVMGIAAVIAAAIVLGCGWPWRAPRPARLALGWVVGIAAAVYTGCVLFDIRLRWPPQEALPRFLLVLLPATVLIELLAAVPRMPRWASTILRLLLAVAAPWVLLYGSKYLTDPSPDQAARTLGVAGGWILGTGDPAASVVNMRRLFQEIITACSCALVVVWYLLGVLQRRNPTVALPLALAGTCMGAGVTVMYSGDLSDGQVGLPLGAAVAGGALASLLLRSGDRNRGYLGIALVSLFSLLIIGHFFGQLTTSHALLLLFAPLLCWVPVLVAPRRLPAWARGLLQLALTALVVVLVLLQAQRQAEVDTKSSPESGEYEDVYR